MLHSRQSPRKALQDHSLTCSPHLAGIEASSETATFTIPASANSHQYTIEIIDDTDPTNYNFSPNFAVAGATGTQTAVLPGVTASSASGAATSTLATSAFTSSVSSNSASASSASPSSSVSSESSASASSASSASASMSSAASSSQSAAAASSTVPSSGAVPMRIPGGIIAVLLGGVALL